MNKGDTTERNVHVRPLKKGAFSFKVYFNNITEAELKTLIWVLEIGGSSEHAHKIGMGKPLGLGSVQISVGDIRLRELKSENGKIKYNISSKTKEDFSDVNLLTSDQNILAQFKTITNFEQAPENVSYPYNNIPGEKETYKWFVANKQIETSQMRPKIHQELPEVDADPKKPPVLNGYKLQNNHH